MIMTLTSGAGGKGAYLCRDKLSQHHQGRFVRPCVKGTNPSRVEFNYISEAKSGDNT
jgi:hypothetical protein